MQLLYPSLSGILNRRIEEDDLVLYPNFMNDRFQSQFPFLTLVVSQPLVPASFVCNIPKHDSTPYVLFRLIKLCTPELYRSC